MIRGAYAPFLHAILPALCFRADAADYFRAR